MSMELNALQKSRKTPTTGMPAILDSLRIQHNLSICLLVLLLDLNPSCVCSSIPCASAIFCSLQAITVEKIR